MLYIYYTQDLVVSVDRRQRLHGCGPILLVDDAAADAAARDAPALEHAMVARR